MTKPELHNSHPVLLKPEGAALVEAMGNYLRMMTPIAPPNAPMDDTGAIRRSGWLDGWTACANIVSFLYKPDEVQEQKPDAAHYREPVAKAEKGERPVAPAPIVPDFTKPIEAVK